MKTHYRRISKTALAKVDDLGEFGAVNVGVELGGYIILHVSGADLVGLPGKFTSGTFEGLKDAARAAVHRARVRVTVDEKEGEFLIPENEITEDLAALPEDGIQAAEGDAVLAVGINPHRFI